ncbi:TniQ family protein [Caulobacter sp. ErkDOM-E]|uniref:TniQ family protein n=1 Tax=Caulobacter sp. ErkDOM-E TaxID=3402778 RepID=UPI003AF43F38
MPVLNFASPPFPDEAISSWLDRIAARFGAGRDELADYLGLGDGDLDYDMSPRDQKALAHGTRLAPSEIALLPIRHRTPWIGVEDLVEPDIETGVRGLICPRCLEEDEAAGRHQYVRSQWLDVWSVRCRVHGCALQNFEDADLYARQTGPRRVRLTGLFEQTRGPERRRRLKPVRAAGISVPCELTALELAIERARQGSPFDPNLWSLGRSWPAARSALCDLSDLLLTRSRLSGRPILATWFDRPDDLLPAAFTCGAPRRGALGALLAPWRVRVLAGVAVLAARPDKFLSSALHGYGPNHLLELQGISTKLADKLPNLVRVAARDPLGMLLCAATPKEIERLASRSIYWPRPLRDRMASAAAMALAGAGDLADM